MLCAEFRTGLPAYLDGTLRPAAQGREAARHAEQCAACNELLEEWIANTELLLCQPAPEPVAARAR